MQQVPDLFDFFDFLGGFDLDFGSLLGLVLFFLGPIFGGGGGGGGL